MPARRDGFDTRRPNQIQPSVVSTEHAGLLTRAVVVRVHPEGPVNYRRRLVAQLADAARSDRADRGSSPREPTIQHAGAILRGRGAAGDGFESRASRHNGLIIAEGRDGDLGSLISSGMRVRFPPPRPQSRFVQWEDSGPTSRSRGFDSLTGYQFDGGRRQTVRRGAVNPVLAGSTPAVHPKLSGRWVIGSPPASGAGPWRFESSRPDHCQIVQSGRTAASDVADRGSSPRLAASLIVICRVVATVTRPPVTRKDPGSSPGPTAISPGFVQPAGPLADYRKIEVRILEPGPSRRSVAGGTAPSYGAGAGSIPAVGSIRPVS